MDPIADVERDRHLLFNHENGEPSPPNCLYDFDQPNNDLRRKAFRWLVDQHNPRISEQRAANREHLLFAAGERASIGLPALLQCGEEVIHLGNGPSRCAGARRLDTEFQVFFHCQIVKDEPLLGYIGDAGARNFEDS